MIRLNSALLISAVLNIALAVYAAPLAAAQMKSYTIQRLETTLVALKGQPDYRVKLDPSMPPPQNISEIAAVQYPASKSDIIREILEGKHE